LVTSSIKIVPKDKEEIPSDAETDDEVLDINVDLVMFKYSYSLIL